MQHSQLYYEHQRLNQVADYVRSMGRLCYIDEGKLAVEVQEQTPNGAVYTITKHISSISEAKEILNDD